MNSSSPSSSASATASASASTEPSSSLTAAQTKVFLEAQKRLAAVPGFQLTPVIKLPGAAMKSTIVVDPRSQSWRALITAKDYSIEMIRTDATTWVKAPQQYWKDFKLPADLVAKAGAGKFVVLTGDTGKRVAAQFDYTNFLLTLASASQTKATSLLPPQAGSQLGPQYVVQANNTTNVATLDAAGNIASVSFVDPGKVETVVPIKALAGSPNITPPGVNDIVTFPMSTPSNSK
ncbi:hypothetical protein [Psychromicrobium lacuslunae]|uniref:Lipoprotein n=1 Tax=Psychromicrobium lacuslunae TaxID=1618207 RepID=A0A0D4C0V9_9MICC|nr:hypothetical protein [Psychromicrobium lacuslunae]AJT42228.1 hypothetical protein UM93_13300 [Psychromicrobium lacuslunae]